MRRVKNFRELFCQRNNAELLMRNAPAASHEEWDAIRRDLGYNEWLGSASSTRGTEPYLNGHFSA